MLLKSRRWGGAGAEGVVVCLHGLTHHGGVFDGLAQHLTRGGRSVVAVDLRGHGESGREPPWNTETHVRDVLETVGELGIERATWLGHSFGGRLAAALAAEEPQRAEGLILLDPALGVTPARALRGAEIDRLDWNFATVDGALNAMLSADAIVAAPQHTVEAFVRGDVRKGPDGRYRFRFCPSAAVTAWSDVALPPPPIAQVPTLIVRAEVPLFDISAQEQRYRDAIGDRLTWVTVPKGHNVHWESPAETFAAIDAFLA